MTPTEQQPTFYLDSTGPNALAEALESSRQPGRSVRTAIRNTLAGGKESTAHPEAQREMRPVAVELHTQFLAHVESVLSEIRTGKIELRLGRLQLITAVLALTILISACAPTIEGTPAIDSLPTNVPAEQQQMAEAQVDALLATVTPEPTQTSEPPENEGVSPARATVEAALAEKQATAAAAAATTTEASVPTPTPQPAETPTPAAQTPESTQPEEVVHSHTIFLMEARSLYESPSSDVVIGETVANSQYEVLQAYIPVPPNALHPDQVWLEITYPSGEIGWVMASPSDSSFPGIQANTYPLATENFGIGGATNPGSTTAEAESPVEQVQIPEEVRASAPEKLVVVSESGAQFVDYTGEVSIDSTGAYVIKDETGRVLFEYTVAGWAQHQFSSQSGRVSVLIDTDSFNDSSGERKEEYGAIYNRGEVNYLLQMSPYTPDMDTGLLIEATQEYKAWLQDVTGHTLKRNPLVENALDSKDTLDALSVTTFAMLLYRTENPTNEQLQQLEARLSAGEDLVVETTSGPWHLQKGIRILYGSYPEGGHTWYRNYIGSPQLDPSSYVADGQLYIYVACLKWRNWTLNSSLGTSFDQFLTTNGIQSSVGQEEGINYYTKTAELIFGIEDVGGTTYLGMIGVGALSNDPLGSSLSSESIERAAY